jgi:hypothetical protein
MQAFASPVEKGASYPTEGQGGYGEKATYPLARKCAGAEVDFQCVAYRHRAS